MIVKLTLYDLENSGEPVLFNLDNMSTARPYDHGGTLPGTVIVMVSGGEYLHVQESLEEIEKMTTPGRRRPAKTIVKLRKD